jgi:hypothetical protein
MGMAENEVHIVGFFDAHKSEFHRTLREKLNSEIHTAHGFGREKPAEMR